MSLRDVERLREIAEVEFTDIVVEAFSPGINELRIILTDGSFVDIWFSLKLQERYSFHWERRAIDGTIYRHDNAPHRRSIGISNALFHTLVAPCCPRVAVPASQGLELQGVWSHIDMPYTASKL